MGYCSVLANSGFIGAILRRRHAKNSTRAISIWLHAVFTVGFVRDHSQVGPAIIEFIAVAVINRVDRPLASHHGPGNYMTKHSPVVYLRGPIPISSNRSGYIAHLN